MTPVFPKSPTIDIESGVLKDAIRLACTELVEVHSVEGRMLASLFEVISQAIVEDCTCGHHDATVLGQHATMKALKHLGRRPH